MDDAVRGGTSRPTPTSTTTRRMTSVSQIPTSISNLLSTPTLRSRIPQPNDQQQQQPSVRLRRRRRPTPSLRASTQPPSRARLSPTLSPSPTPQSASSTTRIPRRSLRRSPLAKALSIRFVAPTQHLRLPTTALSLSPSSSAEVRVWVPVCPTVLEENVLVLPSLEGMGGG